MRRRGGYFIIDVTFGLALVAALMVTLTAAMSQTQRGVKHLAEQRLAIAAAEEALASVSIGEAPAVEGAAIEVQWLDEPAPQGRWVRVTATIANRQAQLVGLAPPPQEEAP